MAERKKTKALRIGTLSIGGGNPISVQSMTKTDTRDLEATLQQIHALEEAGCELIRVAVPDEKAAQGLGAIRREIHIPLAADIHFDSKLALTALEQGVDKLRLNPGNLRNKTEVAEVVRAARERKVPIRIGVNAGSLDRQLYQKYGGPTAAALVESALQEIDLLEREDFDQIVISLKASDVPTTLEAYLLMAERVDYPLHVGITEAGLPPEGIIRSAVGIGALLALGVGDTIRVSLTADPVSEVEVGYEILKSLNLRQRGVTLTACPTCGRCEIDLIGIAEQVRERIRGIQTPLHIAVMGCVVNGPGEAREADVGIAGGAGLGVLFCKGKALKKVPESEIVDALCEYLNTLQS